MVDDSTPFDPLNIRNLANSVGLALEGRPLVRLTELKRFTGAGLYALYYQGPFPLYKKIAEWNAEILRMPIYVGKALVDKARKGGGDFSATAKTDVLYRRVLKHKASIDAATNLNASDFAVRYLVTLPVWIPLGEASLIGRYRPLWNVVMDGFGNNDPGERRRQQYRSIWDIVHPGRSWAERQAVNPVGVSEIERRVQAHLEAALTESSTPGAS